MDFGFNDEMKLFFFPQATEKWGVNVKFSLVFINCCTENVNFLLPTSCVCSNLEKESALNLSSCLHLSKLTSCHSVAGHAGKTWNITFG